MGWFTLKSQTDTFHPLNHRSTYGWWFVDVDACGSGVATDSGGVVLKSVNGGLSGVSGAVSFTSGTSSSGSTGSFDVGFGCCGCWWQGWCCECVCWWWRQFERWGVVVKCGFAAGRGTRCRVVLAVVRRRVRAAVCRCMGVRALRLWAVR